MGLQKNFIRKSKVARIEQDFNLIVNMLSQFANRVYACEAMIKQLHERLDQNGLKPFEKPEEPAKPEAK